MSVLDVERDRVATVRLRGLEVEVAVETDLAEMELRRSEGLDLSALGHSQLGALLSAPRWAGVDFASLSDACQAMVRAYPELVEFGLDGSVRRRVGPPVWVEMVTLTASNWRNGLRAVGRFAPYSARRLRLGSEPRDLDELLVQASYWGVGVQVIIDGKVENVADAETFSPYRYTGASWAFAELTFAEVFKGDLFHR